MLFRDLTVTTTYRVTPTMVATKTTELRVMAITEWTYKVRIGILVAYFFLLHYITKQFVGKLRSRASNQLLIS